MQPDPREQSTDDAAQRPAESAVSRVSNLLNDLTDELRKDSAVNKVHSVLGDLSESTIPPAQSQPPPPDTRPQTASTSLLHPPASRTAFSGLGNATASATEVAQHFGRIKLIRRLGQGSAGVVYEGFHELLLVPVAAKMMRSDPLRASDVARKRFLQEARLAIRITHPNVVRLYEVIEQNGDICLAYEYIDGGSLSDLLKRQPEKRIEWPRALEIIRDTAAALTAAVAAEIVHRDIKPANILLTRTGEAKLADLGLAKPDFDMGTKLTLEGNVVGTPYYMAPEQAICGRDIDIRADLYGLGCTLHEALTGQVPFKANSIAKILLMHQNETPANVCDIVPDVPPDVGELVLWLLAKKPDDRPQSPNELIDAITELLPIHPPMLPGGRSDSDTSHGMSVPPVGARSVSGSVVILDKAPSDKRPSARGSSADKRPTDYRSDSTPFPDPPVMRQSAGKRPAAPVSTPPAPPTTAEPATSASYETRRHDRLNRMLTIVAGVAMLLLLTAIILLVQRNG